MWLKVLIIAFVIILLLYLWLIKPGIADRPDIASLMGHYYAHRGLHDNETDAPENSMNAFKKQLMRDME